MSSANDQDKARVLHYHIQRMRNFLLRGDSKEKIWKDLPKEPTIRQIHALFVLNLIEPCSLKELAMNLEITRPSTSQLVDRLVEVGLISRIQDESDRRQVVLALTDGARKRIRSQEEAILGQITKLMEMIGDEYVDRWIDVATHISKVLEHYQPQKPVK